MKKIVTAYLTLFSLNSIAQNCTREIAQSVPTILEKGFDKKTYAVKDAYGKKLGDTFYPIFANAIQQSKGLHGNFGIAQGNNHIPGLLSYDAYAALFYVYCTKEGKLEWKGLYNLSFKITSNNIIESIGDEVSNELLGIGGDHFVYLDNNIIYTLQPHKAGALIDGYPFIEAVYTSALNAVLVTKKGIQFFLTVTRRQYLMLMKKYAELSLAIQKKSLTESIKEKLGIEAAITPVINYTLNDIKQIDAFLGSHNAEYLNKPCITHHNFESLYGKTFADDKTYFFDLPGEGREWVMINPGYINKSYSLLYHSSFRSAGHKGKKK